MGCVRLKVKDQWVDCTKLGSAGMLIPGDVDEITEITSTASYIVLVEKDAVFQRLCEDHIYDIAPVLVLTARTRVSFPQFDLYLFCNLSLGGMPDVATRSVNSYLLSMTNSCGGS